MQRNTSLLLRKYNIKFTCAVFLKLRRKQCNCSETLDYIGLQCSWWYRIATCFASTQVDFPPQLMMMLLLLLSIIAARCVARGCGVTHRRCWACAELFVEGPAQTNNAIGCSISQSCVEDWIVQLQTKTTNKTVAEWQWQRESIVKMVQ